MFNEASREMQNCLKENKWLSGQQDLTVIEWIYLKKACQSGWENSSEKIPEPNLGTVLDYSSIGRTITTVEMVPLGREQTLNTWACIYLVRVTGTYISLSHDTPVSETWLMWVFSGRGVLLVASGTRRPGTILRTWWLPGDSITRWIFLESVTALLLLSPSHSPLHFREFLSSHFCIH